MSKAVDPGGVGPDPDPPSSNKTGSESESHRQDIRIRLSINNPYVNLTYGIDFVMPGK